MDNPLVVLVNPDDKTIGEIDKISAHKFAMLHRAFSVIIHRENEGKLEILLQQRQFSKYHCGGLWTNTCCSHPLPQESIIHAGERRLMEEMGIQATLSLIGQFHYVAVLDHGFFENELDSVLIGRLTDDSDIPFNPDEVNSVKWISLPEVYAWLKKSPEEFTPWFKPALDLFVASLES
jgi:diphosphomevalonate decarboxylase